MKVRFVRTPTFDDIFSDPDFAALKQELDGERLVRILVSRIVQDKDNIRLYQIDRYAPLFARQHEASEKSAVEAVRRVGILLAKLYEHHASRRLRGALLEGLVRHSLEPRYASHTLDDNVDVFVSNGFSYESKTSVDVAGWDADVEVGECHTCKARAHGIDLDEVEHLDSGLPQCFQIGVVTTDSELEMSRVLRKANFSPSARVTTVPIEDLWDIAPLQAISA